MIIRPSSLPGFLDCARRQAARSFPVEIKSHGYDLREIASSVGASVGTATHSAVASCLTAKMATGELGNQTEDEQRGVQSLEEQIGYGVQWDQTTPNLNTGHKQVIRMYRSYRNTVAQAVKPVAIEQRLEFKTRRGNVLSGQPDLTDDGIHDLKTGVVSRPNGAQYGAYSLLTRASGRDVARIIEDYVQRVDVDKEQPTPVALAYDVELSERVAANTIARVEALYEDFLASGDILTWPANPQSVLCGDRFCPAHSTNSCREHR